MHLPLGARSPLALIAPLLLCLATPSAFPAAAPPPASLDLQAALDQAPGRIVFVPEGDHPLTNALTLRHPDSGLRGPGRLVQWNTNAPFVVARGLAGVQLREITLARPDERQDTGAAAVIVEHCTDVVLDQVRFRNHRSAAGVLRLEDCQRVEVVRCDVRGYMTLAIDDRTASPHYGYSFRCIDGTGIVVNRCRDVLLQGNRILEDRLRPTRELKERHRLGEFVARAPQKGSIISQRTWDEGYVNNWHQGSGLIVTGPEDSAYVRIADNHIENAAQGIDIHADFVTVTGNHVVNAFMGMKAMHGSRHVVIAHNQFVRNDLWSIGLMPGTSAHPALPATPESPARPPNTDGGSIIVGNLVSEFGHGDSHWIWDPERHTCAPFLFDRGQEPDDPPLRDVVISGNLVYATGRDGAVAPDGTAREEPPRYRWAVFIADSGPNPPVGLRFTGNLFHPGTRGLANRPIDP